MRSEAVRKVAIPLFVSPSKTPLEWAHLPAFFLRLRRSFIRIVQNPPRCLQLTFQV